LSTLFFAKCTSECFGHECQAFCPADSESGVCVAKLHAAENLEGALDQVDKSFNDNEDAEQAKRRQRIQAARVELSQLEQPSQPQPGTDTLSSGSREEVTHAGRIQFLKGSIQRAVAWLQQDAQDTRKREFEEWKKENAENLAQAFPSVQPPGSSLSESDAS